MKAVIIIQGIVQGVGYRFFTVEQARCYRIRGYVQNLPIGNVKVAAEGNKGMLNEFVKKLKIGPPSAHVSGIDIEWSDKEDEFIDFDVRF